MSLDNDLVKRTGIAAAYKAGTILRNYLGNIRDVTLKGTRDLVTEADVASEEAIIETIMARFPDHCILAEESGQNSEQNPYQWIIDPLDGTTNFAHELGLFCVSIAFSDHEEVILGIVLNPVTGELFLAEKDQGAFLNGHPIHVSKTDKLINSLLATGFPYDVENVMEPLTRRFQACLSSSRGIRRLGSAALDLCYVACGRFDGFWEQNLKPWDTAAGLRIVLEAGGQVSDFSNGKYSLECPEILATNGRIHRDMISILS